MINTHYLENPIKNIESSNVIYGLYRTELALEVSRILNTLNLNWFIESGTLLGAWRNNKLLPEDDDFDMAVILDNNNIDIKLKYLKRKFDLLLPTKYSCRIVNTYCHKLEIYEEQYGNYILPDPKYKGADFHNVTIDLQVYYEKKNRLFPLYYVYKSEVSIPLKYIYPIKTINLENNIYNCPYNPKKVLESIYGYLGKDYILNIDTGKYEKKE